MPDAWISAKQAIELLAGGMEHVKAARHIKDWASKGLVPTRAKLLWKKRLWQEPEASTDSPIPAYFWNPITPGRLEAGVRRIEESWSLGNFEAWVREDSLSGGIRTYREALYQAFGVEFEGGDLLELLPPHLKAKTPKRGRPEDYDWAAASASVCERIERGVLRLSRKSVVEKALLEALASGDKHPAKSTIQRHASPIWEKYGKA